MIDKIKVAEDILGPMGRILSSMKKAIANNKVFWNGNIFDSQGSKIWYGDIDITTQKRELEKLSKMLGEKIFVTREHPYRFSIPSAQELEHDSVVAEAVVAIQSRA